MCNREEKTGVAVRIPKLVFCRIILKTCISLWVAAFTASELHLPELELSLSSLFSLHHQVAPLSLALTGVIVLVANRKRGIGNQNS